MIQYPDDVDYSSANDNYEGEEDGQRASTSTTTTTM